MNQRHQEGFSERPHMASELRFHADTCLDLPFVRNGSVLAESNDLFEFDQFKLN